MYKLGIMRFELKNPSLELVGVSYREVTVLLSLKFGQNGHKGVFQKSILKFLHQLLPRTEDFIIKFILTIFGQGLIKYKKTVKKIMTKCIFVLTCNINNIIIFIAVL